MILPRPTQDLAEAAMVMSKLLGVVAPPPEPKGYLNTIRWLTVKNTTAEVIPRGAVAEVFGRTDEYLSVRKPTVTSGRNVCIIHPYAPIGIGDYGVATFDVMVPAKVTSPVVANTFGPVSGSWSLGSAGTGFVCVSGDNGQGLAEVVRVGGTGGGGIYRVLGALGSGKFAVVSETYFARDVNGATDSELTGMTVLLTPDPDHPGDYLFGPYRWTVGDVRCTEEDGIVVDWQLAIAGPVIITVPEE